MSLPACFLTTWLSFGSSAAQIGHVVDQKVSTTTLPLCALRLTIFPSKEGAVKSLANGFSPSKAKDDKQKSKLKIQAKINFIFSLKFLFL
jgi:hypothetical protein